MLVTIKKKGIALPKQQITNVRIKAKKAVSFIFFGMMVISSFSMATDNPMGAVDVNSLRGAVTIEETPSAEQLKKVSRQVAKLDNNFVGQPPMVPHSIRNYEVSKNANKCLSCHSWKNAPNSGAVKISVTHYQNREGQILSDVSPRRYFCLQCHVPQVAATPLIENDFTPVKSLKNE